MLMDSNFGDPYRLDKRAPCVGEHQLHINPQAARDLNINDGDYVYIDANPRIGRISAPSRTILLPGLPLHAAGQVQPRLSVQHRHDEACAFIATRKA